MSRGYLVIAQNTTTVNYLEQAYALALSLQLTQTSVRELSVCVDAETKQLITQKHREVFDQIIDIPWNDDAAEADWKINNKWKYFYMTPYTETVVLDTDMIFPTDVSYWWEVLSQRDVWVTTNVRTFRNEIATSTYYRPSVPANNLPNVYTAFFYFKRSELAAQLFAMAELIFHNWQRFYFKYMPKSKPDWLSGDIAFALAIKLLGIESECTHDTHTVLPTFVHMKPRIQNIADMGVRKNWCDSLPTYYDSYNNFKVGNFQQTLPFHYVEPEWMTSEKIKQMEREYFG